MRPTEVCLRGWVVRWLEDGRHPRAPSTSRKHALAFEIAQRQRLQLGAHAPANPSKERLGEWVKAWWDRDALTWARSTRLQRAPACSTATSCPTSMAFGCASLGPPGFASGAGGS